MGLFFHYLSLPYLLQGISVTLSVTLLGLAGGLAMGLVFASMQLSRFRVLSAVARTYAVIFRGTPLILQLVFVYDALPHVGIKLSPIASAALALAANEAPFIAEIFRAGVLGVDRGQVAAGQALGMTPLVLMQHVIAPQAIRAMVPALGNESVTALKNSSLASVIAVQELTLRSEQLASSTFDFFSIFFASGLMYLALTGAFSLIQLGFEVMLDLDRPSPRERLMRLLPWRLPQEVAPPALAAAAEAPRAGSIARLEREMPSRHRAVVGAVDRTARATEIARHTVTVEVRDLHKGYGGQEVLKGIDLTVRAGEIVALLGPSGSGKSTLLRCINRLETWDSGTIRVGGRALGVDETGKALAPREVANARASVGVGMVFQQFNLFSHLTARENVAGPLRWVQGWSRLAAQVRAHELLDRVGLTERAGALPRHLSGGQQQRVAIARALAPSPSVLLLDEPTSALDPELVGEVLEVIQRLAVEEHLTMIIATHQIRFAEEVADRVVFLTDGVVTEEGPAYEVLHRPKNPATARFLRLMAAEGSDGPGMSVVQGCAG